MTVQWNGEKLLNTIIFNEKKVAEFYRQIAANGDEKKGALFFEKLAQDEERHESIYTALLKQFEGKSIIELEEDDANYMDLLLQFNLANDFDEILNDSKRIWGRTQIYDLAERVERDAVFFVSELMRLYPDLAPEQMAIILKEEKKHLQMILERQRDFAMAGRGM